MKKKLDRLDPKLLSTNPRATLSAWLKYKETVLAAYRQYPKNFVYRPINMSSASVCSKLRDAIRGQLAFGYTDDISNDDLSKWFSEVVFKNDNEYVYIGLPNEVKTALVGKQESHNDTKLFFPELSFEEVAAFSLLISGGRLIGPVIVKSPPDITLLPPRPNVEMMERPDGSLVLL